MDGGKRRDEFEIAVRGLGERREPARREHAKEIAWSLVSRKSREMTSPICPFVLLQYKKAVAMK